jgi:hypothetical protein
MNLDYSFWIRSSMNLPIYKVDRINKEFCLHLHYIDQDMASWGDDNYSLTLVARHKICEMTLEKIGIPPIVSIAENPQDLYDIRSIPC